MTNLIGNPAMPGGAGGIEDALQRGMAALNQGLAQEAEQVASGILKAVPRNVKALYIRGAALVMQGREKEAIPSLVTAARGSHDPEG